MLARVYKSTGNRYLVRDKTGKPLEARIRGIFRIDGITSTNPIAVGDEVELEPGAEGEPATIVRIVDRKNYLARSSPHQHAERHIIAANLDQAICMATLRDPRTSTGFIDRFLVAAQAYHVPAVIIVNKADLYREKELRIFSEWTDIYTAAGYRILLDSVRDQSGLDTIKAFLTGKTSLIAGHSGVGKSSLINALFPGLETKTLEVSAWSGKGMHTTTFAEMFDLPGGGFIIDTPGIREFGIIDIAPPELSHYFPEMRALLKDCQFNNCLHVHEPGCAVKSAVEEGQLAEGRYLSYLGMLDSLGDGSGRRRY